MRGSLHTGELVREVTNSDTGLRTESPISHGFRMEVSAYPKTLLMTDAAIYIYPALESRFETLCGLARRLLDHDPTS